MRNRPTLQFPSRLNRSSINALRPIVQFLAIASLCLFLLNGCSNQSIEGSWAYQASIPEEPEYKLIDGVMKIELKDSRYQVSLISYQMERIDLDSVAMTNNETLTGFLTEEDELEEEEVDEEDEAEDEEEDEEEEEEEEDMDEENGIVLSGKFNGTTFKGYFRFEGERIPITATRLSDDPVEIDRSDITYILTDNDLSETEFDLDHRGIIEQMDGEGYSEGTKIYNSNCINCHGTPDLEGSLPTASKFWQQSLKAGNDPYSMYQTISKGFGAMPPQLSLTPKQKYNVLTYIREQYIRRGNPEDYFTITPGYLSTLPEGSLTGPDSEENQPWSEQDYGNFFSNTIELVDEETGPERYHSPGPVPYADEDYSKNNFAYKGIAVRLDEGEGGVAKGNAWMLFDHDVLRVAGGWTGEGFIDWNAILLNEQHETYPRTVGKLHFETPVGPGWANPKNGSFEDPRYTARDGRKFGPLPREWADYKGVYHHEEHIVFSYSVGKANILEELGREHKNGQTIFTRTLNISPTSDILKMIVAPAKTHVRIKGKGASLSTENGFIIMTVAKSQKANIKLFIADADNTVIDDVVNAAKEPESLRKYTSGGKAHYPQTLTTSIIKGSEDKLLAIDQLTPPFDNPWNCQMKFSGIDFMPGGDEAVLCTTDGDIWSVKGLAEGNMLLRWRRIGAGLFQPLGIKVIDGLVYVSCRDQIVRLRDLNADGETDFYESFNHDHQVTDHFHEFAMGLQTDSQGNLYYAKSGRHAREALIPQHGTLIKVSKDGKESKVIASGFRAANGVCINPDGSFLVTDQEGYWNPANRINWVQADAEDKFYGNMWSYNPPKDTTRLAMEKPMVWVDMEFDRSPSELLWVDSEKWGAMNGSLLSFSYGYGKIQLVLHEQLNGQAQGGVIDIPDTKFYTGVMRGRFHPMDEHLYLCGMAAWSTSSNVRPGDLYRVRYTGNPIPMPIEMHATSKGMTLKFAEKLDPKSAAEITNYEVNTWNFIRSSDYGSERYDVTKLKVSKASLKADEMTVELDIQDIQPVDAMTITYNINSTTGVTLQGTVQSTLHTLGKSN
nr:DUF6797 domain-containing protein [Allomuricauda sp.]